MACRAPRFAKPYVLRMLVVSARHAAGCYPDVNAPASPTTTHATAHLGYKTDATSVPLSCFFLV